MKLLLAFIMSFALSSSAAADWADRYRGTAPANPVVIGSIYDDAGYQVDFFASRDQCPQGERSAARYPQGDSKNSFYFCWRMEGVWITMTSMAGGTFTYNRQAVVPRGRAGPML